MIWSSYREIPLQIFFLLQLIWVPSFRIPKVCPQDRISRCLRGGRDTVVEDGLSDEIGHDLGDGSVVLSATVEDVFYHFV